MFDYRYYFESEAPSQDGPRRAPQTAKGDSPSEMANKTVSSKESAGNEAAAKLPKPSLLGYYAGLKRLKVV